jgi:CDP-ribitol ribitolphosphotransferase
VSASPVRIESIGWERPQFVVRLQDGGAGAGRETTAAAAAFALIRADRPTMVMPPTGSNRDAGTGALVLRFNIVVGPGVRPLAPGRWLLVQRDEAQSGDRPVAAPDASQLAAAARAFAIPRGTYRATPVAEPSTGGLALDMALETTGPVPGPVGRAAGALRAAGWTLVFEVMKAVARRSGHRVLFVTGNQNGPQGNLKLVHDRMVERGLGEHWQIHTLIRRRGQRPWREHLAMRWALARADVILVDGSRVRLVYVVQLDPDVRFIQLWHGSGSFKTVHYSRLGLPNGPDPWSVTHRNYTHVIVLSEDDVPYHAEAFGVPEERVVATGIPRMDRYFDEARRVAGRAEAQAAYPETNGRFTILFAPTYRDTDDPTGGDYPIEIIDYAALHALCLERDAVVIIRMHPFARQDLRIPEAYTDRLLDGYRSKINVNDLLFAVDLLVTDYSSIVFEFATFERPMLFFAYDLDEYMATRDVYIPYESFVPGRIVRTFPELLDAIRREDYDADKVAEFVHTHFAFFDSGSTDRVIDQLVIDGRR